MMPQLRLFQSCRPSTASVFSVATFLRDSYDGRMSVEPVTRIKSKTPVPYELSAIHHDTHDTKTFCFALPDDATLDMLPGDFLYVHATIDGKQVKRPYTPSSMPGATGYFDLTVKRYETGVVSKYLHARGPGDRVLMSGPNSGGHWVDGMAKRVGFVAGGTGITPMICYHSLDSCPEPPCRVVSGLCQQGRGRYHFPRGVGRGRTRALEFSLLSCSRAAARRLVARHGPYHRGHAARTSAAARS